MVYLKFKFISAILLIFSYFSTSMVPRRVITFDECIQMMKEYCNAFEENKNVEPTTLRCVQVAIEHWQLGPYLPEGDPIPLEDIVIPQDIVNDYYRSWNGKLEVGSATPSPSQFCEQYKNKPDIYKKCMSDLELFGQNKDLAVEFALYYTRKKNYETEPEKKEKTGFKLKSLKNIKNVIGPSKKTIHGAHFGLIYMINVQLTVGVSNEKIQQPRAYCEEKCPPSSDAANLISLDEDT